MLIPVGEMRQPITVLTPTVTTDESGGEVIDYSESDFVYAAIRSVSSVEAVQFGQVSSHVSHVLFGHYSDLNALQSSARIRDLDTLHEYDVTGPPINSPKRDHTRLNLVRRENG